VGWFSWVFDQVVAVRASGSSARPWRASSDGNGGNNNAKFPASFSV